MHKPLNRRQLAQRARRDAEREQAEPRPGPPIIPAGTVVGHVELCLHGRSVRAELLHIDGRCRTYRVRIGGAVIGRMGADKAWSEVSRMVPRMPSIRSEFWQ
jgi:hypothetical protein